MKKSKFVLFIVVGLMLVAPSYVTASSAVGELVGVVNSERYNYRLEPLKENLLLNKAAQMKAEDMIRNDYFSHTSPRGIDPWYWMDMAGYDYEFAGENLAMNIKDSEEVVSAWMESPMHKANIVSSIYTDVGTGVAKGEYKGQEVVVIVEFYANSKTQSFVGLESMEIQQILASLGYYQGTIDGIFGPMSRAAVAAYQSAHPPLTVDGLVGPQTLAMLMLNKSQL